jgi:prepilin-type N-terminal cleavage/methylation domain-containing protein
MLSTASRTKRAGFTFIEVLVVSVIIAVLAAILTVSFVNAGAFTRDARRKKDLANLQAALEAYKLANGAYPESSGCTGEVTWPGCIAEWIPGLIPEYAATLPVDPKQNYSGDITGLSIEAYTYNYTRPTAVTYQLITRLENENDAMINGSAYGYSGTNLYVVVEPK